MKTHHPDDGGIELDVGEATELLGLSYDRPLVLEPELGSDGRDVHGDVGPSEQRPL